ncbi:MAG: phosphomannomutase [Deltaproteobacteria bacterium]|nr:phosphomannomutase [Candidatus Tharpella aukensis]
MTEKTISTACFKAYDIRGRVPDELNEELAYRLGRAFAVFIKPKKVAVGRDVRPSSQALATALSRGLNDGGADVLDLGLCGTEEVYFATFNYRLDGGIMVTASHNPGDYNGMKLVRHESRPLSGDYGLPQIEELVKVGQFPDSLTCGRVTPLDFRPAYIKHLLGYIDLDCLKPLKVVVNAGNGCAGVVLDELEAHLPFTLIKLLNEPDGSFPHGIPNPLLPENRSLTSQAVIKHQADVGLAWDGDFDRCFFFDEHGRFIEGYYIVGLLAENLLTNHPGANIVHDPRLTWNTIELVSENRGQAHVSRTGHAFIKDKMRELDALYGGEMSAHHYFKDFSYCDSGMIPWLLVLELISKSGRSLSELVDERIRRFPVSGEINLRLDDPQAAIAMVEKYFSEREEVKERYRIDGLSLEFADWRFNLRSSNTEPLLRLNVESRGDRELMESKTKEILDLLKGLGK